MLELDSRTRSHLVSAGSAFLRRQVKRISRRPDPIGCTRRPLARAWRHGPGHGACIVERLRAPPADAWSTNQSTPRHFRARWGHARGISTSGARGAGSGGWCGEIPRCSVTSARCVRWGLSKCTSGNPAGRFPVARGGGLSGEGSGTRRDGRAMRAASRRAGRVVQAVGDSPLPDARGCPMPVVGHRDASGFVMGSGGVSVGTG